MDEQPIPYPPGFERLNPHVLEDYINARCIQFGRVFVNRCGLTMTQQEFEELIRQSLTLIPVPPMNNGDSGQLQLVFRHDCLSLGCLDPQCSLCENNPNRRCETNFDRKYLVNDVLKAKCAANIRIEVVDRVTGILREDPILDQVQLEICVLDGNNYDAKCLEVGQEREEDLESCFLLENNKGQPLLQAGGNATNTDDHKVRLQLQGGKCLLPELRVTDSSEALLSGRKPPFRLLVKAVAPPGHELPPNLTIHHAISEAFVLATRRTRTAGKVDVPNVEDHVGKLEHMGKETVKKLKDLKTSADQAGVEVNLLAQGLPNSINKVGEFRKLALMAEADGHLRQKLQQMLKLSKEKWEEARDHALRAVVVDNYLRVWYSDDTMSIGVLFPCRNAEIDLERPIGLLQKKKDSMSGGDPQYEVILLNQQTPVQRQQIRTLQRAAVQNWWRAGHIGWAIFPVDSEQLATNESATGADEMQAAQEPQPAAFSDDPGQLATAFGQQQDQQPQQQGLSPFANVAQEPFDQQGISMANPAGAGLQVASAAYGGATGSPSGPALPQQTTPDQGVGQGQQSASPQLAPATGPGGSGSSMFFSNVPSTDFQQATNTVIGAPQDPAGLQFPQFGGQFSSLSGAGLSGSLDKQNSLRWSLLKGMDSLEYTGSGIDLSKLESMELPPELSAEGFNLASFPSVPAPGGPERQNSGLESMQSIEHALPQVPGQQPASAILGSGTSTNYVDVLEAAARDFRAQQQQQQQQ